MNMTDLFSIPFGHRKIGYWNGGFGGQSKVYTKKDIIDFVDEHLGIDNIGLSVCTYKEDIPYLLFLPFDFDSKDLKKSWKDAIKLFNHFTIIGLDCHLTFSGRKGFHVFLSVVPKNYNKYLIKKIQVFFKKELGLKTMDPAIFGQDNRLMRIPYTFNIGGDMCKEIRWNKGNLLDLDMILAGPTYKSSSLDYDKGGYHKYPCIEKLIREDPEPRELIRLSYVALRLDKGWTEEEILEEIKSFDWIDFDEEKTRNKIRYISDGNYRPLSCKSMEERGYCKEPCKYRNGDNVLEEVGIL